MTTDNTTADNWIAEIRSDISQRIAAVFLFGVVEWMGVSALLSLVSPASYRFFKVDTSGSHWWFEFAGTVFFCGLGVYTLVSTFGYVLRADAEGVLQSNGFWSKRVRWGDVHSYTMERIPNRRTVLIEPVFRDANGNILFQPNSPLVTSLFNDVTARAEFWSTVLSRVELGQSDRMQDR